MKSAVRMTRLQGESVMLSLAVVMTKEELIAASETFKNDRSSNLPQVMEYARRGNLDMFLCFLRSLMHNIWVSEK